MYRLIFAACQYLIKFLALCGCLVPKEEEAKSVYIKALL